MTRETVTIRGVTFQTYPAPAGQDGRSLSYTPDNQRAHYLGTVASVACPVCLLGMPQSHGRAEFATVESDANGEGTK